MSSKDQKIWQERTLGAFQDTAQAKKKRISLLGIEIPFYFVESHNDSTTISLIRDLGINCLLNAGTPRKLKSSILLSVKYGVVNIHPGILPAYRGASAVEWAIFNDEEVGNTAHFMTENYDEGPIIRFETYKFSKDTSYEDIRIKVYSGGCELAAKVLEMIVEKELLPSQGLAQDTSKAKFWKPISSEKLKVVREKLNNNKYRYQIN